MRDYIIINSQPYKLARQNLVPEGARRWSASARPSQAGDPGELMVADWKISGPNFLSFEQTGRGVLGVDYTTGVDTRWEDFACLGPLVNTVTAPSATYTRTAVSRIVLTGGLNAGGNIYAYCLSGREPYKVDVATMTAYDTGIDLTVNGTDLLYTKSPAGTEQISIAQGATAYRVVSAVGTGAAADTETANNETAAFTIFGNATDRVIGLTGQTIKGNVLSTTVDMDTSAWALIGYFHGQNATPTGFGLDGSEWILGYDIGPVMLDGETLDFFPLMPEAAKSSDNCSAMTQWFPLGTLINMARSTRYQRSRFGESIGPERYSANTSIVNGRSTAFAGTDSWLYVAIYDEVNADTYLCWVRPRQSGDWHDQQLSWYVLAKFTGVQCKALLNIDTGSGKRTSPTLVGGHGNNFFYLTMGRYNREVDDTSYAYATSGDLFLTEMRRYPHLIKDLEAVEFESDNCTANRTITLAFSVDGGSYNTLNGSLTSGGNALNGVVNTDGRQRLLFVDNSNVPHSWAAGSRIKPKISFASNVTTASPQLVGLLRLYYKLRSKMTKVLEFTVVLDKNQPNKSAEELEEDLMTNLAGGRIAITDPDDDTYYVRIDSVRVREQQERGGSADRTAEAVRVATITATKWATTGGE